ncbi:MAG: ferritin-like domain-containing protein [Pseudomonadota bacterium]
MTQEGFLFEALCHILGNTCRIERTAKSYEWNATGAGALDAARCFRAQADELQDALEPLALHVLGLGGRPILDYSDEVVAVNPPGCDEIPPLDEMVSNLAGGHEQAMHSLGAAMDLARAAEEMPTLILLASRIEAHRLHGHRLGMLMDQ